MQNEFAELPLADRQIFGCLFGLHESLSARARPLPYLRDAHTPVRLTAHRHSVEPRSRIQAGAESIAAPLVRADARNIEVLTDFQFMNTVSDLAVLARLLNSRTEISVLDCDAVSIAAGRIDDLIGRDGTVRVDPVAPTPTECCRRVGDLLTVAVSLRW